MTSNEASVSAEQLDVLDSCSIGLALDKDCHKRGYCRKVGLTAISDLSKEDQDSLKLRCDVPVSNESNICHHHQQMYIHCYEELQRKCCDPYGKHKNTIKCELTFF